MPTSPRDRILQAAAQLLAASGGAPVSTRAICEAAGVGAPTLYHHFGDKQGLFDAVVAHGFERYLAEKKATEPSGDPVEDLRRGWDTHVEYGRTHPAFYTLMYGSPRSGPPSAAATEAHGALLQLCRRAAEAGRLRVPPELAARMVLAANTGVTLSLISAPDADAGQLSRHTRDAILDAITVRDAHRTRPEPAAPADHRSAANALAGTLGDAPAPGLTARETGLLREWLDRIAAGGTP
ncbi:TetR/AcrR family transcriptional regulator [Streptomyces orinoci]|uniref:TetR/AcrR family transcriptional regulator n=1 Tax=Streptomyces orinoci TaxID=67339 RepID=A0ABV3JYP9_STRON|nr:TetR/AcrR family transcriptional regulator [Streptomyces orinoci]